MRKHRSKKFNIIFGATLSIFCAAMLCTLWFVAKDAREAAPPYVPAYIDQTQPPTTEEERTLIPVAAAAWSPVPRRHDLNSALMGELSMESAKSLVDKGFRSIVLPALELYNSIEVEATAEVLNALAEDGVFRTLPLTPLDSEELPLVRQALADLISLASFDAILLLDHSGMDESGGRLTLFVNFIGDLLSEAELALPLLFGLGYDGGFEYRETVQALAEELGAELLVDLIPAQASQFAAWARDVEELGVTALLDIKSAIPNGSLDETVKFLEALQGLRQFPMALRAADFIPRSSEAAQLLARFFAGDMDLSAVARKFSMQRPVRNIRAEQTITATSPTINFTGGSNPLFPLALNGQAIQRNDNGDFSIDRSLNPGRNTFTFEHQNTKYIVHVMYEVKILDSVSPTGRLEATGGIDFTVSAVALRGATVRASLAGQTITLQPGAAISEDGESREEADGDFITYEGRFRLPDSRSVRFDVGTVIYSASYNGLSASRNGALVAVLPEIVEPPPPPPPTETATETTTTTATESSTSTTTASSASSGASTSAANTTPGGPTVITTTGETTAAPTTPAPTTSTTVAPTTLPPAGQLLTPATNHGLGTARMAEITTDYANARLNSILDSKFVPSSSPLLQGTFDYIVGQATINGGVHYLLASGKRVHGDDLRVINSGFRLPRNNLQAAGRAENGMMTLRFNMNWKVPFNVDLIGQSYSSAFAEPGYTWGVGSFNATGLEITFYHTGSHAGNIDFSGSNLISGATWSQNSAENTVTLRLSFSNAGRFYGWQAVYEGNQLVIRLSRRPPATLSGAVIVLDPGHGGRDPGAPLAASHPTLWHEKQLNLALANKARARLQAQGAIVHMTRGDDSFLSLHDRTRFTRRINPDVFVSIHCDSSASGTPMGTSAFYYRAFSQPLARAVQGRLVRAWREQVYTSANGFGNIADLHSRVDRGIRFFPYFVARVEECPAVLVEVGFGSNLTECRALQNDRYQDILAQAIVDGIADYLRNAQ